MKKFKVNIMKWLGMYDRMVQLELEIAHLQSKIDDQEMSIDSLESDMGEKVESYEINDYVEIDMDNHIYEIEEIIEDWSRGSLSGILDERMDILLEKLANEDTIREIVSRELDNHPLLDSINNDTENTTWDMNEIVQEVLSELVERLS